MRSINFRAAEEGKITMSGPIAPKKIYVWLDQLSPLLRMIGEARKLLGTAKLSGAANKSVSMGWASEIGGSV